MTKTEEIIHQIREQGLLPLFYHEDADVCFEVVNALYAAGIRIIEFTNRGKNALENFKQLLKRRENEWPDLLLAIGTIKNEEEAEMCMHAGADFIICPGVVKEVGRKIQDADKLWIPGCMTTTEIMLAEDCGARLVKLFPGSLLGPGYLKAIKDLFPNIDFMPTGGVEVEAENIKAWFDAGVCAVGMGSKLISKDILLNKDFKKITRLTKEALGIIKEVKTKY